ncbi:glyceraldehyde-3-phosphate dehydrogenase/erythrose-4-phosphate dehydrogenase [Candidatus Scalindua japonica]|uniref:Glyceraldehyde-3-phosphate dehydrogenase/erythrose-4-phosphate dehydrogenase n=1 Tax=Candidatus Scalindua japonica TaxID=1284222 RepID=A0A286TXH9_9BACT|nr:glyceraldehyde-3-phosphate dehydrogenase/erythrose-4-phosphate dehydrogenase [Candidatus Scalindua japonica]
MGGATVFPTTRDKTAEKINTLPKYATGILQFAILLKHNHTPIIIMDILHVSPREPVFEPNIKEKYDAVSPVSL